MIEQTDTPVVPDAPHHAEVDLGVLGSRRAAVIDRFFEQIRPLIEGVSDELQVLRESSGR